MRRGTAPATARPVADPSSVAFSGRTDAVSAGLVRDSDAVPPCPAESTRPPRLRRAARRGRAHSRGAAKRIAATALAKARATGEADLGEEASGDVASIAWAVARRARRGRRRPGAADGHTKGAGDTTAERPTAPRHDNLSRVRNPTPKGGGRKVASTARGTEGLGRRPGGGVSPASRRPWAARARMAAAPAREAARETARKGTGKGIAAALSSAAAPLAGVLAGVTALVLTTLIASQAIGSIFGMWSAEDARTRGVDGLPPYVTYEMVEAALECQERYGHPAGCTIAQIIVESGCGDHLSSLATRDNNLFGIKWDPSFALCPEVDGKHSWQTQEEYGGQNVTIVDSFTRFKSPVDCITFRSRVFLQAPRYADNESIRKAVATHDSDLMARGLKEAGWATSSEYVALLTSVMDAYGLRRFDSMAPGDLASGVASGSQVVAAATSQLGTPYVWGGTTPGVGLDCSGLTQWCYRQAGIEIPRTANAQHAAGSSVPLSEARPGDILWRDGHVAIYAGDDTYIHAPKPGDVVKASHGISNFTCAVRFT